MFGSTILEVAIGMVFVYLLLSLVCSVVNEFIEARMKRRARELERGILTLFGEAGKSEGLVKDFFEHPLIKGLGDNPSYIPSRTFSLALWNLASGVGQAGEAAVGLTRDLPKIRKAVESLPNAKVRQTLLTLIDEANNDFDRARENVERWYDDVMDRVSGWYKRKTQWILLALGFAAALCLNVDSVTIANTLSQDAALRTSLVEASKGYAAQPTQQGTAEDKIKENLKEIRKLGLPIGWTRVSADKDPRGLPIGFTGEQKALDVLGWWLSKLFGLSVTALAISLGAPFWFDVLNKFMVVRSTIKPHEKSGETPSKDKPKAESEPEDKEKNQKSTS